MSLLSRGRLIMKFVAVVRRLDPAATAAVANGGFDDDFNEILPAADGTALGASSRREMVAVRVRCQVSRPKGLNLAQMTRGGSQEATDLELTLFSQDLEAAGLVDTNNVPLFRPGDRIQSIEDLNGVTQWAWSYPPGLIVQSVEPRGYGAAIVGTPRFNLVVLHCHVPLQAEEGA